MASISRESNGRRIIQFVAGDGKRKSIRLGKVPQRAAEAVKVRVEHLVAASITAHAVDDETARWLAGLDDTLRDKLAAVSLVPEREAATLGAFLSRYIALRSDVKSSTVITYRNVERNLIAHFGADKSLREITPGDADEWRLSLIKQGLADNTVRRRSGKAKQFFKAAQRRNLIASNPFAELVAATRGNPKRAYFVTRDEAQKVLEACPDGEWRLIFALSRYAGLRCPSEHLGLRWVDVDWAESRMTVHSPKTEHHEGGASRVVPIFPELRPHLLDAFERADDGAEHVITRYRDTNANLRTQLTKIIRRAGLEPWPRLFNNLRATRETELAERWPMHVVCAWIGNSPAVAAKHYLQVTDDHFERAAQPGEAVQNPVQQSPVRSRVEPQHATAASGNPENCVHLQDNAAPCEHGADGGMGDTGLEPVTSCMSSTRSSQLS